MSPRVVFLALFASACSLDGLADGSDTGGSTSSSTSATTTTGGAPEGAGGTGGVGGAGGASPFTWITSFGTTESQGTNPSPGDDSGSTLRMSDPATNGEVWIAAVTRRAMDPDGDGGFAADGSTEYRNLFLLKYASDGELLTFRAFPGESLVNDDTLSVGAVVRLDADAIAVVGTFKGGSVSFGDAGTIEQSNANFDDGFVVRLLDDTGEPTDVRQLSSPGSGIHQTARAAAVSGGTLLVAGKLRNALTVTNPNTPGVPDAACSFTEPAVTLDAFERSLVAVFSTLDLQCTQLVTFEATPAAGTPAQQAHAIAADASGVYVAGSFTRDIVVPPLAPVAASGGEDGFVVALDPDLSVVTPRWIARVSSIGTASQKSDGLRALTLSATGGVWIGGYVDYTTAVEGAVGVVGAQEVCPLPPLAKRDGLVAALDPSTGACEFVTLLGGAQDDEVRGLRPWPDGRVLVSGFVTGGIEGLTTIGGGSRDGYVALVEGQAGSGLVAGGYVLGGTSWDYLDGVAAMSGAELILAGSFGVPFDVLEGEADFFAASIRAP